MTNDKPENETKGGGGPEGQSTSGKAEVTKSGQRRRKGGKPGPKGHMSLRLDLPKATVELLESQGIKIEVQRLINKVLRDQAADMMSSDGCISTPSGPSC